MDPSQSAQHPSLRSPERPKDLSFQLPLVYSCVVQIQHFLSLSHGFTQLLEQIRVPTSFCCLNFFISINLLRIREVFARLGDQESELSEHPKVTVCGSALAPWSEDGQVQEHHFSCRDEMKFGIPSWSLDVLLKMGSTFGVRAVHLNPKWPNPRLNQRFWHCSGDPNSWLNVQGRPCGIPAEELYNNHFIDLLRPIDRTGRQSPGVKVTEGIGVASLVSSSFDVLSNWNIWNHLDLPVAASVSKSAHYRNIRGQTWWGFPMFSIHTSPKWFKDFKAFSE